MAVYHGKSAQLYAWDGTATAHTSEACTESANTAQITDTAKRILDPNETQTFTDSGSETVTRIDYTIGKAWFTGTVGTVTATGKHVAAANIDLIANLFGWNLEATLEIVDVTCFGATYKETEVGMVGWSGNAEGYILNSTWKDYMDLTKRWFIKFYINAANGFMGWANISGLSEAANINEVIKEAINFHGYADLTYF